MSFRSLQNTVFNEFNLKAQHVEEKKVFFYVLSGDLEGHPRTINSHKEYKPYFSHHQNTKEGPLRLETLVKV